MAFMSAERRGSQSPRFELAPEAKYYDAGDEAVELYESTGNTLMPWQRRVLRGALAERADGTWAAFEVGLVVPRQNGKGTVLEAAELYWLVTGIEKHTLHSAQLFKTSLEAFTRLMAVFDASEDLSRMIKETRKSKGSEGITLINGSRLDFVSRGKDAGRGLSGGKIVLDEAYALKPQYIDALMPVMSAQPNGQIWYTSTPPLDTVSGQPLFDLRKRALAGAPDTAWFDWGAPLDSNLDDTDEWYLSNPSLGYLIKESYVAKERRGMGEDGFGRERLGIWPESADTSVIKPEVWQSLADTESQIDGPVAFALDVTPSRSNTCIAAYGRRADGHGHVEVVDHRPGTGWAVERLVQLMERHETIALCIDSKGPAGSLIVDLQKAGLELAERNEDSATGRIVVPSTGDVASGFGQFVDAVNDSESIRHLDQATLNTALAGAATRPLGDGQAWARRSSEIDISPVVSATLARWAYESRAHLIEDANYDLMDSVGF